MTGSTKLEKKLLKNPPSRLTDLTTTVLEKKKKIHFTDRSDNIT